MYLPYAIMYWVDPGGVVQTDQRIEIWPRASFVAFQHMLRIHVIVPTWRLQDIQASIESRLSTRTVYNEVYDIL